MIALAQTLKINQPNVHLITVGSSSFPDNAEAREVARTMVAGLPVVRRRSMQHNRTLLGACADIVTTTLVVRQIAERFNMPLKGRNDSCF